MEDVIKGLISVTLLVSQKFNYSSTESFTHVYRQKIENRTLFGALIMDLRQLPRQRLICNKSAFHAAASE